MRAVLLLLATAACADGIVIEVVIPPDSPATQVELFLGFGSPCKTDNGELCPGIGPPTDAPFPGRPVVPGTVFHVDDSRPFVADVDGRSAWFSVDSADLELPVVIAVGSGPNGPDSVAIAKDLSLADSSQHIRIHLEPAGPDLIKPMPTGTNVKIWPEPAPHRDPIDTCVGAEFRGERVFIVPRDNPDCDDVAPAAECNRLVFEAVERSAPVALEQARCSFEDAITPFCRLGGQICDEAAGGDLGCANMTDICISSHMCKKCPELTQECVDEAFDLLPNPPIQDVTLIKCNVQVERDTVADVFKPCVLSSTKPALLGEACDTPMLSSSGFPFDTFTTMVSLTNNGRAMQLFVENPTECTFKLHHVGDFPLSNGTPPVELAMWTTMNTTVRQVVLPVLINWVPVDPGNCSVNDESICALIPAPNDNLALCFQ